MNFLSRVLASINALLDPEEADPPHAPAPTGPVGERQSNWSQMQEVLQQIEDARHRVIERGAKGDQDERRAAALKEEKDRAHEVQREMLDDILQLHQRLGTGFQEGDLRQQSDSLRAHYDHFRPLHDHRMTHVVLFAILHRFHQEARKYGWSELVAAMKKAGVEWPEPTGLSPTADDEERAHARELQLQRESRDFLAGTMLQFSDLVLGVVPIWRAAYPERGSSVWVTTALTAVGAALALRYHQKIVAISDELRDELTELVGEHLNAQLKEIQEKLAAGVDSIGKAMSLTDEVISICRTTAPDLVWQRISPRLG